MTTTCSAFARPQSRVMVIGKRLPDYFADNLLTSLDDNGHITRSVATFAGLMERRGRVTARLREESLAYPNLARRLHGHIVDAAEDFQPDVIINVDSRLSYPIVADIRSAARAPIVFWFPDSPGNLRRETHLLANYDALYLKDSAIVQRYRDVLGLRAFYLPQGCNPRWHRPQGDLGRSEGRPSVVLVGNMYVTRYCLARELRRADIQVYVHGSRWAPWLPHDPDLGEHYSGRPVFRDEKARVFRSASVVLNSVASHEADGLNVRLFEAAGCGAIVLSEWRDRLPELFAVPEEVRAYRSLAELIAQVRALAELPDSDRDAMATAASARAHGEHTYSHRFDAMIETLGRG